MTDLIVHIAGDSALLEKIDGSPVFYYNYIDVIKALRKGRSISFNLYEKEVMRDFMLQTKWIFPNNKNEVRDFGKCVYFLINTNKPELIKIGQTENLPKRTKAFDFTLKGETTVLAVGLNERHKLLEDLFLKYFSYCRVEGEWFKFSSVIRFLDAIYDYYEVKDGKQ